MSHKQSISHDIFSFFFILSLLSLVVATPAFSEPQPKKVELAMKGRWDPSYSGAQIISTFDAISLPRGGVVHISSQKSFREATNLVSTTIQKTHSAFELLFGPLPAIQVQVKLLKPDVFSLATGAPDWANALFYQDTIIIPVKDNPDKEDLIRSIRHEFTHAVIHTLSGGKAPGWLDEGLAQYMEGAVHPLIRTSLIDWINKNPPIPFNMVQSGFTKLEKKYVAAAYGQSLWAVRRLLERRGPLVVRNYFENLRHQRVEPFLSAIGTTETGFETELGCVLQKCIDSPGACKRCRD